MKVIIVEDEILAQQELSWLIKTHSQMEIVGCFEDGLDVLKFLQHNRVDAIFLDINSVSGRRSAGAKYQSVRPQAVYCVCHRVERACRGSLRAGGV